VKKGSQKEDLHVSAFPLADEMGISAYSQNVGKIMSRIGFFVQWPDLFEQAVIIQDDPEALHCLDDRQFDINILSCRKLHLRQHQSIEHEA
jgi:hypothetical protein